MKRLHAIASPSTANGHDHPPALRRIFGATQPTGTTGGSASHENSDRKRNSSCTSAVAHWLLQRHTSEIS
eukprot:COSAG02_NODE_437_length_22340_cov_46.269952_5_plen_70_part_00